MLFEIGRFVQRQVCQSRTVSTKGFTPRDCAQNVPNRRLRDATERHRTEHPRIESRYKHKENSGLGRAG